ncbi:cytochrome b [Pseudomonas sp. NA-150]|uniref:cytochrome b n=1 Tax=Pseudomonas sp. NA-150 TaxID=3367525 RepID=UPI0037CAF609
MRSEKATGYTATAKWLHWGIGAIWIVSWCLGMLGAYTRDIFSTDPSLTFVHKGLASTVLFLVILRVAWRLTHPVPALPLSVSSGMRRGAAIGHLFLYLIPLCLVPLSGWYWSSVAGKPIMLMGFFRLPSLVGPDQSMYDVALWTHTLSAWLAGALVGGHILLALKHHFLDRDAVLSGMLPEKR